MKKKLMSILCAGVLLLSLVGCGSDEVEVVVVDTSEEASGGMNEMPEMENMTITVGQVTEAGDDELTIQVADMENSEMAMGSGAGMMGSGELPEGEMSERELPEGEEGEVSERELPEGEEGEMSERELPEGAEEGELPEGEMPEGEMPEGGMTGVGEDVDYSEVIELTDEYATFTISDDVTITMSGEEVTFVDIEVGYYVVITQSEDGTIVSIEILG